jgi:hypothetical protein
LCCKDTHYSANPYTKRQEFIGYGQLFGDIPAYTCALVVRYRHFMAHFTNNLSAMNSIATDADAKNT